MASQRVLVVAIGGWLATTIWDSVHRWSNARTVGLTNEWSSEQRPPEIRDEIDAFVDRIIMEGFMPPILYRSEHVDCWSMGDVYDRAIGKPDPRICRKLFSNREELIVTWVRYTEQIVVPDHAPDETQWLYNRINEAAAAWGELAEYRLIILIRRVLGGLCEDYEMMDSLKTFPAWWPETE